MKFKKWLLLLLTIFSITIYGCFFLGNTDKNNSLGWDYRGPTSESNPTPTPTDTSLSNNGQIITIVMPDNSAYAVLVGVSDYGGEYDLTWAANDPTYIKNSLQGSTLWSGASVTAESDIQVTKEKIQNAITTAKNTVANTGLFVFYFSGHGTNSSDTGYIIPYDGISDSSKLISETELQSWFGDFNAAVKKVIFFDSCHSGHFVDQKSYRGETVKVKFVPIEGSNMVFSGEFGKTLTTVSNLACITACAGTEVSIETSEFEGGAFTHYVAQGLGTGTTIGPADIGGSDSITAEEIHTYTRPLAATYAADFGYSQNAKISDSDNAKSTIVKR